MESTRLLNPTSYNHRAPLRSSSSIKFVPPLRSNWDLSHDPDHWIHGSVDNILPCTTSSSSSSSNRPKWKSEVIKEMIYAIPSILIASMLILMVCIPFGLSMFPTEWTDIPTPRSIGIQIFLFTTMLTQILFTLTSSFKCPIGCMMVENIPFMHTLAMNIIRALGPTSPQVLPTILFVYSSSSVFVGILFYILGHYQLGSIMYFFPRHILLGAIGGIGIFVIQTGFENAIGVPIQWFSSTDWQMLLSVPVCYLWGLPLVLVILLNLCTKFVIKSPFFPPFYFLSIPPLFYLFLTTSGISLEKAHENGWFFEKADDVHFYALWEIVDIHQVAWHVLPSQITTLLGLSFFSLMHVPINIPSLSLTTGIEVDINAELKSHGLSNALSGLCGGVQNYLCYSFSALYYKCGGGGVFSSLAIATITGIFFIFGPNIVVIIPRAMAGALMMHIGFDLLKEALYETHLDVLEYATVGIMTIVMTCWGMNQGLAVGAILACATYVLQSVPKGPIRGSMSSATLRSSAWRTPTAFNILDNSSTSIHVVQLQGHLFFGNVSKLREYVHELLDVKKDRKKSCPFPIHSHRIDYLIIDFTLVIGMDSSAADRLSKMQHLCRKKNCQLVFASIPPAYDAFQRRMSDLYGTPEAGFHITCDLNSALEYCEDRLLTKNSLNLDTKQRASALFKPLDGTSPNAAQAHLRQLQALCPSTPPSVINHLLEYFTKQKLKNGQVLWTQGEPSVSCILLAAGRLRGELEHEAGTTEDISVGSFVGELCLLTGEKRKCTLRATAPSIVYILTTQKLDEMVQNDCALAFLFQGVALRYASNRLQYVGNRIWETKCMPF